ncbi:MAG: alpha/beta hydrolase [Blastococcus sp.]
MEATGTREKVWFASGGDSCAAWFYPGTTGACVVMAAGMGVPKEPGTDRFARRFQEAGFAVLAFDYPHLGESGGTPRQVVRVREQLADWDAALAFAASLPGVDPTRLVAWGFSSSGGHVIRVAAGHPELAAAIAQTPNADGVASARNAGKYQSATALLRLMGRAVVDAVGWRLGFAPLLVPLAGERGSVALLTTPDARKGDEALNPDGAYPDWPQVVAARSALTVSLYRPGRSAPRVRCPLLVLVCDQDESALAEPAVRAGRRAPVGSVVHLPGDHYAPFQEQHEAAVEAELAFLERHLGASSRPSRPARSRRLGE